MRQNNHVNPARATGTPSTGNGLPLAKMPANNNGTFPVHLGAGQSSQFGKRTGPSTKVNSASQSHTGGKANTPAHNGGVKTVTLGHTKHGVGEVPGYLKGRQ